MFYRKKPVTVEAITFDELVELGRNAAHLAGTSLQDGMPWSFTYRGQPITHESNDCYLIPTLEGVMRFERGDMLITGVQGEIYPCKRDIFDATYERVETLQEAANRIKREHDEAMADLSQEENDAMTAWEYTRTQTLQGSIWNATNGEHIANLVMNHEATVEEFLRECRQLLVNSNIIGENDEIRFVTGVDHAN